MSIWEPARIKDKKFYLSRLGLLKLWIYKEGSELKISECHISSDEEIGEDWEEITQPLHETELPDRTNWRRWIVSPTENKIKFLPVMPDRSVLVRPDGQLHILPGNKACFYVSIPVWLRVHSDESKLIDIPTQVLSNTWFGDPLQGEFCYAVKTTATTSLERKRVRSYTAICPICIENLSNKSFVFQRLAIHTEYLSVYQGIKHLWTNEIDVKLEGEEHKSVIDVSENAPNIERISRKLTESREKPSKKFYRKIFSDFSFIKG